MKGILMVLLLVPACVACGEGTDIASLGVTSVGATEGMGGWYYRVDDDPSGGQVIWAFTKALRNQALLSVAWTTETMQLILALDAKVTLRGSPKSLTVRFSDGMESIDVDAAASDFGKLVISTVPLATSIYETRLSAGGTLRIAIDRTSPSSDPVFCA